MPPRPETETELFFNSFQFGDIRKPHRLGDDTAKWAAMTKLLVRKSIFFFQQSRYLRSC